MQEPIWITPAMAQAIHSRQLSEHGGADGVRDETLLHSALNRAPNVFYYGGDGAGWAAMASAYAYGLATNHPFVDGNKRTVLVCALLFLELNGYGLTSTEMENYQIIYDLAAGQVSEEALTAWFAAHLTRRKK